MFPSEPLALCHTITVSQRLRSKHFARIVVPVLRYNSQGLLYLSLQTRLNIPVFLLPHSDIPGEVTERHRLLALSIHTEC